MTTLSVYPSDHTEGVSTMLTALGEARIAVHGVSSANGTARYLLSVDAPAERAEHILQTMGYRVARPQMGTAA